MSRRPPPSPNPPSSTVPPVVAQPAPHPILQGFANSVLSAGFNNGGGAPALPNTATPTSQGGGTPGPPTVPAPNARGRGAIGLPAGPGAYRGRGIGGLSGGPAAGRRAGGFPGSSTLGNQGGNPVRRPNITPPQPSQFRIQGFNFFIADTTKPDEAAETFKNPMLDADVVIVKNALRQAVNMAKRFSSLDPIDPGYTKYFKVTDYHNVVSDVQARIVGAESVIDVAAQPGESMGHFVTISKGGPAPKDGVEAKAEYLGEFDEIRLYDDFWAANDAPALLPIPGPGEKYPPAYWKEMMGSKAVIILHELIHKASYKLPSLLAAIRGQNLFQDFEKIVDVRIGIAASAEDRTKPEFVGTEFMNAILEADNKAAEAQDPKDDLSPLSYGAYACSSMAKLENGAICALMNADSHAIVVAAWYIAPVRPRDPDEVVSNVPFVAAAVPKSSVTELVPTANEDVPIVGDSSQAQTQAQVPGQTSVDAPGQSPDQIPAQNSRQTPGQPQGQAPVQPATGRPLAPLQQGRTPPQSRLPAAASTSSSTGGAARTTQAQSGKTQPLKAGSLPGRAPSGVPPSSTGPQ
ncbi:MAG: hypothetical protein M1825_003237 [Sarcosagium campestre]|nr:MAG: hypothetical protein M1825_003237 [Sarcosagium campestre]